jgi:hypothetical protein
MIISSLKGGLGNQIFQWAYGKFLSEHYSVQLYLDISFYDNQMGATEREFSLNKFPNLEYYLLTSAVGEFSAIKVFDNFHYNRLDYNPNHNYYLDGYWQSEKYFFDIEYTVRKNLKPDAMTVEKLTRKYPVTESVSLHIRRTDYQYTNDIHPIQTIDYYEKALNLVDYENILVFSDDILWCKNNLDFNNMIFVENNDNIEDMWLMSLCKDNIIANSSFSWWGAWLNENKYKKVIAPSIWFGEISGLNYSNIVPNNWIKI